MTDHTLRVQQTPFEQVPHWLFLDRDVTAGSLLVYVVLRWHRNYQTGECWPSRRRLADLCRMDVKTVQKCLANLVDVGAISIVARKKRDGSRDSNLYTVHWDRWGKNSTTLGEKTDTGVGEKTVQELRPNMNKDVPLWIQQLDDGPEFDSAYLAHAKGLL